MLIQFENSPVVEPQTLPHRITALDRGIKWADARFIAVEQASVDIDDQVSISFVELLEHVEFISHKVREGHKGIFLVSSVDFV